MGDDVEQCMMPIRGSMALYIGGMGARDKNFYNDYAKRLGFEEAAVKIQDLYLAGRKDEAMAAVPAELIDACHLVGPADRIKERLQRWTAAGNKGQVSSMLLGCQDPEGSGAGRRDRALVLYPPHAAPAVPDYLEAFLRRGRGQSEPPDGLRLRASPPIPRPVPILILATSPYSVAVSELALPSRPRLYTP